MTIRPTPGEPLQPAHTANGPGRAWTEHIGTGLTLSYLALVAVGMFHSVLWYRHFGISILDYAEASDFLLAPFRDPMVLLVTVLPLLLALAYLGAAERMSKTLQDRRRAEGKGRAWWESSEEMQARFERWGPVIRGGLALFWVFVSSSTYQRFAAYRAMRGEGTAVRVELTTGAIAEGSAARPLVMVGTTSRYVFLFRTAEWRPEVVTADNVLRILPVATLPPASRARRERSWRTLDRSAGAPTDSGR